MKNKMIDLNNALFAELERLQDEDEFKDENGKVDQSKVELAIKRADAVSGVAGRIMEAQRLQLDAVKVALSNGVKVAMPETLGLESALPEKMPEPKKRLCGSV